MTHWPTSSHTESAAVALFCDPKLQRNRQQGLIDYEWSMREILQCELEEGEAEKLQNSAFCCKPMLNIFEKRDNTKANSTNWGWFFWGEKSSIFQACGSQQTFGSVRKWALIAPLLTDCLQTEHKSCMRQSWPCPLAETWRKKKSF